MFYVSALNADPWIVGLWWFIMEFVFTCIYGASVVLPVLLLMTAEQRLPLCEFSEARCTLGRPVMSCCDQVHNCNWENVLCLVLCLSTVLKTCVLCLRPASSPVSKSWTPSSTVGSTSGGGRRLQKGVVGVGGGASGHYCFKICPPWHAVQQARKQARQWILLASSHHQDQVAQGLRRQHLTRHGFSTNQTPLFATHSDSHGLAAGK